MPQQAQIEGIGTVEFPDDAKPQEIQEFIDREINSKQQPKTTALGAAARGFGTGLLPSAATVGTAALLEAAAAPETVGGSLLLIPPTLAAGWLAGKLQQKAIQKAAPQLERLQQADVEQHPWASLLGEVASALPSARLAPARLLQPRKALVPLALGGTIGATMPLIEGRVPGAPDIVGGAASALLYGEPRFTKGPAYAPQERTQPQSRQEQRARTEAQRLPTETGGSNRTERGGTQQQAQANVPPQVLSEADYLDAERQAIAEAERQGSPIKVVDRFEGEAEGVPFSKTVALSDRGGIELNRNEFRNTLRQIAPERRAGYIESLIGEEHIHRHVSDADAGDYWNSLSALEKSGEIRQYAGEGIFTRKALNEYLGRDLSDSQLGHEALRRRIQNLIGQTPTEIAASALRERWTIKTIDALGSMIRKSRELLGTSASERGLEIVGRAEQNLAAARAAVAEARQASIARRQAGAQTGQDIADELGLIYKEWPKEVPVLGGKGSFTDPKTGLTIENISPGTPKEEVQRLMQAKLKQDQPASIRRKTDDELMREGSSGLKDLDDEYEQKFGVNAVDSYRQELVNDAIEGLDKEHDRLLENATKNTYVDVRNYIRQIIAANISDPKRLSGNDKKLVDRILKDNPELEQITKLDRMDVDNRLFAYAWEKLIQEGFDPGFVRGGANVLKDPQLWSEIRTDVYNKNPALARWIENGMFDLFPQASFNKFGPINEGVASIRRRQRGEEGTPKLPLLPGATPEDRLTAEQMGAGTRMTPQDVDRAASEHLQQETERVLSSYEANPDKAIKPITFDAFTKSMQGKFEGIKSGQLYEAYSKALYNRLFNSSGRTLEALQKSLGIKVKGRIPDPPSRETPLLSTEGATPEARAQIAAESKGAASRQKYRIGAIRMISDKLLAEARPEKPTLTKVSPEHIRYSGDSKEPPFFDISRDDLAHPELLGPRLAADARRSNRDPVSLTKRVTALLDKQTGKVYLVSTYPHGRAGAMLVDPSLSQVRNHKPLGQLLSRYRPVSSMLLDEPVRAFRQSFDSLGDYEAKLATDARRNVLTATEAPLREGEQQVPGSWETGAKITDAEAGSILDHIYAESGTFDSPEDVKASLAALKEDTNFQVLSGYRKLAAEIVAKNPDLTDVQVQNQLAKNIYENNVAAGQSATPFETFIRRTMAQGGAENREGTAPRPDAGQVPPGQELTMPIERRPPTDVRPENVPRETLPQKVPPPPVPEGTPFGPNENLQAQRLLAAKSANLSQVPQQLHEGVAPEAPTPSIEKPASIRRRIQQVEDAVKTGADTIRYAFSGNPTEDLITRRFDDSHNAPNIQDRQVQNDIRLQSGKKLGDKNVLAGANAIVKTGALFGDRLDVPLAETRLIQFQDLVAQGLRDGRRMQQSGSAREKRRGDIKVRAAEQLKKELDFAQRNLNNQELINTAKAARDAGDAIYQYVRSSGIPVNYKEDYIPSRFDMSGTDGKVWFFQEPRIIGTKWREPAVFDNPYQAIAVDGAVYVPATRDVASLMGHATRKGLELVQRNQFKEFVKAQQTSDGRPVAVNAERSSGPSGQLIPPQGFAGYRVVGNTGLAVHPDYVPLLRNLTQPSIIEDMPITRSILHFEQLLKHNLMLGDFFHLGRVLYYGASLMRSKMGFSGGWAALDFAERDLPLAVRKGIITQKEADWGLQRVPFGSRTVTRRTPTGQTTITASQGNTITRRELLKLSTQAAVGFNIGRIQDALYKDVFTQLTPTSGPIKTAIARITDPTTGRYNRFLFDKFTRGLMAESFVAEYERQAKRLPGADPLVLMRDISRDVNNFFGNIGRQGWMKSKSSQDIARMLFLAPQWVEGLIKKEVVGASRLTGLSKLTGQRQGKSILGATGVGMGTGLLFMYGLAQAINLISRGKPTWQNPEQDHKFDAYIPTGGGREEGLWLNPASLFAEISHDLYRLTSTRPTVMDAIDQIAGNKESPIMRAAIIARFGHDDYGTRYTSTASRLKAIGKSLTPVPISFGRQAQFIGSKLAPSIIPPITQQQLVRQTIATLGVKTEPTETAYVQTRRLAERFMQEKGYEKDTGFVEVPVDQPSYSRLRSQLRNGDTSGARRTYNDLLKGRNFETVVKAMRHWATSPVTGSKKHEAEFVTGLSDEELNLYTRMNNERFQTLQAYYDLILSQP